MLETLAGIPGAPLLLCDSCGGSICISFYGRLSYRRYEEALPPQPLLRQRMWWAKAGLMDFRD
jgi:hypothetical protein